MIDILKNILGFTTSDYDFLVGIFAIWILAFFMLMLANILNALFKKVGGW